MFIINHQRKRYSFLKNIIDIKFNKRFIIF